jgi:hypothetical protein
LHEDPRPISAGICSKIVFQSEIAEISVIKSILQSRGEKVKYQKRIRQIQQKKFNRPGFIIKNVNKGVRHKSKKTVGKEEFYVGRSVFIAFDEREADKVVGEHGRKSTVLAKDNPEPSVGAALCGESEELEEAQGVR